MAQAPPAALTRSDFIPLIIEFVRRILILLGWIPGLSVTSWFRTPGQNQEVGGDPESQHLFALAVDVDVPPGRVGVVLEAAHLLGMTAVNERTHVHIQLFPAGALARVGVTFPT